ncbi:hypothetical protein Presley_38 [Acinetobacter phage Presley]|uniref:Uncharacterized protein n=1 Tax=Acinetobacter phage Presley TaxID=1406780 RepID=U5PVT7_9CAUD|nr:hypothetical protein Presley_38 [Acinetobacter phage Presley]AGY48105.1 hypothetical protein Presley_38 [Acinetobacter phage Presley]
MSNKVTQDDIDNILTTRVTIYTKHITTPTPYVEATAWLDNQFILDTAISKAVDPANFDLELGTKYARDAVLRKATDKLWQMEGYLLHNQINKERASTFLTRLKDEYNEVNARATKLAAFLQKGQPDNINTDDWEDLTEQYMHQSRYEEVLAKRLRKLGHPV